MKLNEFLHFNSKCPVCNNNLTLYLQITNSVLFKAEKECLAQSTNYKFIPFKCCSAESELNSSYINLYDYGSYSKTSFSDNVIAKEAKLHKMYFFFLCNEGGFEDYHDNYDYDYDYDINVTQACYYRSTSFMEYRKGSKGYELENLIKNEEFVNREEVFSFVKNSNNIDNVYVLQLNGPSGKTNFTYFTVNEEQKNNKNYEPKLFEKEFTLKNRPNFDLNERDKLFNRMSSWVNFS
jgi:hypothetical protein